MNLGAVCFHMTRFSHCSCHSRTVSNSVCLSEGATVTKGAGLTISVIMAPNRCSYVAQCERFKTAVVTILCNGAFTPDANEALSASDLHVKSMQRRARHPAARFVRMTRVKRVNSIFKRRTTCE